MCPLEHSCAYPIGYGEIYYLLYVFTFCRWIHVFVTGVISPIYDHHSLRVRT